MYSFYELRKYCDVSICFNDVIKIKGHKIILSNSSKYFDTMFSNKYFIENQKNDISINISNLDNPEVSINEIIKFMYNGKLDKTLKDYVILKDMLKIADYLIIDDIIPLCITSIVKIIDFNNCLDACIFSEFYNLKKLNRFTYKFIRKNIRKIYLKKDFIYLSFNVIDLLLRDKKTVFYNEDDVLCIILQWLNNEENNKYFHDVLKVIRFSLLSEECAIKLKIKYKYLFPDSLLSKSLFSSKMSRRESTFGSFIYISDPNWYSKKYDIMYIRTFNYITKRVKTIDSIPFVEKFHSVLHNDVIYFLRFEGSNNKNKFDRNFNSYDIVTKSWNSFPKIDDCENFSSCVLNNKMYLIGGEINGISTNRVLWWDFKSNYWNQTTPMRFPKSESCVVPAENFIFVIGGKDMYSLDVVERFDTKTQSWSTLMHLPIRLKRSSGIYHKGFIYIVGGISYASAELGIGYEGFVNKIYRYDISNNYWIELNPLRHTKINVNLGILDNDNKIYAIGGDKNNTIEVYNISTNTWSMFGRSFCNLINSKQCNIFTKSVFFVKT
ncbi:Kelch-like protein [Lumpy skin disease virus]|uniref:Kelch-like protein n=1 Tax=Lumpy skin disease virus TaxID=59509 RepID=A0A8E7W1C9_LSDV|nr:Kelch-like protein [Lumpy skin disease virus]UPC70085.1 Kelch-like protein [Lumpy skin disease virus]UVD39282.1 Kelch-like protein [Lumpy skin disease virus]UYM28478.1 Kelch-like protein [Lumpy skin disease virus]WHL25468.1 kelch repeat and BTB domain-containing protein A55 [Lumpy skin disease virus]